MLYSEAAGEKISRLGFGMMRLPLIPGGKSGDIDQETVNAMVDCAIANGVNYFDTAAPYHEGLSEAAAGKALGRYPRESYFLADKYPGHQIAESYDPAGVFEEQLKKCGVEYFDFYLLHNVNESSIKTYLDKKWGIIDYFKEQRRLGRIRHLGFSCHADPDALADFLDRADCDFEFCQIQCNYLDWTLQDAKKKYEILTERGIPVWVMEPVRGGKLANLPENTAAPLKALRPDESVAAWGFRFLQGLDNIKVVLSGMSTPEQMEDNIKTFSALRPLDENETKTLFDAAETLKDSVPCTGCRYCCDGCPMGLNIPGLISLYNECRLYASINISMKLGAMGEAGKPANCVGCGACQAICPQGIHVPELMPKMAEEFAKLPDWAEVCRQRDEAAKRSRKG